MYTKFQESYYGIIPKPLLNRSEFIEKAPIFVIDSSKQPELSKAGTVDVRLEWELASGKSTPANTSAKCLIIHDRIVKYRPISGEVRIL